MIIFEARRKHIFSFTYRFFFLDVSSLNQTKMLHIEDGFFSKVRAQGTQVVLSTINPLRSSHPCPLHVRLEGFVVFGFVFVCLTNRLMYTYGEQKN